MWQKASLVILGAVVLSTLGIEAADVMQGKAGRFTGTVFLATEGGPCSSGETLERFGEYALCVDTFEASPDSECVYADVKNEVQSNDNMYTPGCSVTSAPDKVPWRFISYTQAQQLCSREDKRLLTAREWYRLSIGIATLDSCVLSANEVAPTGSGCMAPNGVYDLVGNVWEWVDDTVTDGQWQGKYLPQSGYVSAVTADGVVVNTSETPSREFGEDYATVAHDGERGVVRGGFYGSGSDGGIFAQNLSVPLDLATAGVGFRCVRDVE